MVVKSEIFHFLVDVIKERLPSIKLQERCFDDEHRGILEAFGPAGDDFILKPLHVHFDEYVLGVGDGTPDVVEPLYKDCFLC